MKNNMTKEMKKKVLNLGNFALKGTWSDCSNDDEHSVFFSLDMVNPSKQKSDCSAKSVKNKNRSPKKESQDASTIVTTNKTNKTNKSNINKIASLQDLEDYDCFDFEEETLQKPNKNMTRTQIFKNGLFKKGWFKSSGQLSKEDSNIEVTSEDTNSSTDSSDICSDDDTYSEEKDRPELLGLEWLDSEESRQSKLGWI